MQVAEEHEPGNGEAGERFTTLEQKLRGSTIVKRLSQHFERFATVAIKGPRTMEETTESSDKEQSHKAVMEVEVTESCDKQKWQPYTVNRVKFLKENEMQTEVTMLTKNSISTAPSLIVENIDNEVVSGEARHEDGQRLS